jgi:hypothetical protein
MNVQSEIDGFMLGAKNAISWPREARRDHAVFPSYIELKL